MKKISYIFILIIFSACGAYENIELESALNKRVDSLYNAERVSLKKITDSLCNEKFDAYYKAALDTIRVQQLEKIEQLIKQ